MVWVTYNKYDMERSSSHQQWSIASSMTAIEKAVDLKLVTIYMRRVWHESVSQTRMLVPVRGGTARRWMILGLKGPLFVS